MNRKDNKIPCESCGFYKDKFFLEEHKSGKYYCTHCVNLGIRVQAIRDQINHEEVEKILKGLLAKELPKKKKGKKLSK